MGSTAFPVELISSTTYREAAHRWARGAGGGGGGGVQEKQKSFCSSALVLLKKSELCVEFNALFIFIKTLFSGINMKGFSHLGFMFRR